MRLAILPLAALLACCPAHGEKDPTLAAYRQGLELATRAQLALGGTGILRAAGAVVIRAEGSWDLGTRLQGLRPGPGEPVAWTETLALDTGTGALAYEYRTRVNADAEEWLRYVFLPGAPALLAERLGGQAFWLSGDAVDERARYARILPRLLLAEALEARQTLRYLGEVVEDGEPLARVGFTLASGEQMTLLIAPDTARVAGVDYLLDMPLYGDTVVSWRYGPETEIEGLGRLPSGYRIALGGRPLKEVRFVEVRTGAGAAEALLGAPPGIEVPPPPEPAPEDGPAPGPPSLPEARSLAEGIYLVPNIRPGFHVLLVEFDDFLAVVDAPSGWYELQQLPAKNFVAGISSGSVGRRLLEVAAATVPGKPVRYLVLTHFHSDHAGGLRAFQAAGTTLVGSPVTAAAVRAASASVFTLDPGDRPAPPPVIETVDGRLRIGDGTRTLELMDVGPNPHAEGLLVAWLPEAGILYLADLFEPLPPAAFPSPARIPAMRFFVDWLDQSGLEPERIYAIHGQARVTPEQLELIRGLAAPDQSGT